MTDQDKTVSLVLGSGGARGLAHIGIIEWLNAHGYEIKSIAGTSMGALVGGIYAAGKLDVYSNWVRALARTDVLRLLDVSFRSGGLFKGDRIINVLKQLIGEFQIEALPISYTAVATDLNSGKEVWLSRGPLFDAIRASIAVPAVFTPYVIEDRTLVDGSLVSPVPIAPTLRDITDLTVAVDLSGAPDPALDEEEEEERERPPPENPYRRRVHAWVNTLQSKIPFSERDHHGPVEIVTKSYETMQTTISRLKLAVHPPDVVISIPRNAGRFFEFYRAAELIELGRRQARAAFENRKSAGSR